MPQKRLPNSTLLKMSQKQLDAYHKGRGYTPKTLVNKKPVNKPKEASGGSLMAKGSGDGKTPAAKKKPVQRRTAAYSGKAGGGGTARKARRAKPV